MRHCGNDSSKGRLKTSTAARSSITLIQHRTQWAPLLRVWKISTHHNRDDCTTKFRYETSRKWVVPRANYLFFNSISSVSWFWTSSKIGIIFLDFFAIRSIAATVATRAKAKMPASCVTTDKPNLAQILASMNHAYQGAGEKKFTKCRKLRRFIRGENTKKRKFIKGTFWMHLPMYH